MSKSEFINREFRADFLDDFRPKKFIMGTYYG